MWADVGQRNPFDGLDGPSYDVRTKLVAVLVLTASLAGCLDQGALSSRFDPEVTHEGETAFLFFSYANATDAEEPPSGPEDTYEEGTRTFTVAENAVSLDVGYDVDFQESAGPVSQEIQRVVLELRDPDGEPRGEVDTSQSVEGEWSFEDPQPGTWTVDHRARGEGTIFLAFHAFMVEDA